MSGNLIIRNSYSDAQSVILYFDTRELSDSTKTGRVRASASLKIDIGREGVFRLPEYLLEESSVEPGTDSEPQDQLIERQGARIKTLEALQHNSLVAADETDHYRIQELMSALSAEREKTKALSNVHELLVGDFHANAESLSEDQLEEIEHRHSLNTEGNLEHRVAALKTQFENADVATQVGLFASTRVASTDDQRKRAMVDFARPLDDPDAKHTGDVYRGADSTTDLRFMKNPSDEPVGFDDLTGQRDESAGAADQNAGGESLSAADTDHDSSHKETQAKADEMIENDVNEEEAGENAEYDGQDDLTQPEDLNQNESEENEENDEGEDPEEESNNPEPENPRGTYPHDTHGGTTPHESIEDRPVKMDDPEENDNENEGDDNVLSKVSKLKVGQLTSVERDSNLSGEGTAKVRKDAIREAFNNADDEGKASIAKSVNKALEE